ncbi:MAG: hypothetical protein ACRCUE_16110 [Bosea sp. (in: a-proteobacteria)]
MEPNRRLFVVSIAALLALPATAEAHQPRKGPNGGELVDAGNYHVEVVGKGTSLEVYVSDALDRPLKANEFKALAIMVIDGKSHRIPLEALADGTKLRATAPGTITRVRGAIQLTDKDGKTVTGRVN